MKWWLIGKPSESVCLVAKQGIQSKAGVGWIGGVVNVMEQIDE